MFFADDSFIFCKASAQNASNVLEMLKMFERASGQQINVDKSSVIFSNNTHEEVRSSLKQQLKFSEAGDQSLYLGLPSIIHRKKSVVFGYLKNKLSEKIQSWDKRTLSKGGKKVLLKTVSQSLPNYAMSVFLLPVEVCQDLERIMCKYWWQSNPRKNRSIHWMNWRNMCKKKSQGGLGLRNIQNFNVALLGKQGWRMINNPDLLVSKIFKACYFHDGSFLSAKVGSNPSYVWRSIVEAQSLLKQGCVCRVGRGNIVSVINDPWLPDINDPYIHTRSEAIHNAKVSALMSTDENQWDRDLILDIFDERDAMLILSIPINTEEEDTWYWKYEKMGNYTVKSAYNSLSLNSGNVQIDNFGFWRQLWNLKIPPKVKHFLWRAVNGCLPTKDNLRCKRVDVDLYCPTCQNEAESTLHALVTCSYAENCWSMSGLTSVDGTFQFLRVA